MTIAQWLQSSDKDFATGVKLYLDHSKTKVFQSLFKSAPTSYSRKKLIDELTKLATSEKQPIKTTEAVPVVTKPTVAQRIKHIPSEAARSIMPEDVVIIDRMREESFKEMAMLHARLPLLKTREERLAAVREIDRLDQINEECWYKLDYWAANKKLPTNINVKPIKTIGDVVLLAKNIPTYISKLNKRLSSPDISDNDREDIHATIIEWRVQLSHIEKLMDKEIC